MWKRVGQEGQNSKLRTQNSKIKTNWKVSGGWERKKKRLWRVFFVLLQSKPTPLWHSTEFKGPRVCRIFASPPPPPPLPCFIEFWVVQVCVSIFVHKILSTAHNTQRNPRPISFSLLSLSSSSSSFFLFFSFLFQTNKSQPTN